MADRPAAPDMSGIPAKHYAGVLMRATCVALGPRGVLIVGPSGSGKSTLALELMALGATLVADDATLVTAPDDGPPVARAPPITRGLIEARYFGVLAAATQSEARISAVIDMGQAEDHRLPPERTTRIADVDVALFHKVESRHFASAILQYLKGERSA